MAWIRAFGNPVTSAYPWDALQMASWNTQTFSLAVAAGTGLKTTTKSPIIESGCRLIVNTSSTNNTGLKCTVLVSTDGNSFTSLDVKQNTADLSFDISLTSYVGSELYIQVWYNNQSGLTITGSVSECKIVI